MKTRFLAFEVSAMALMAVPVAWAVAVAAAVVAAVAAVAAAATTTENTVVVVDTVIPVSVIDYPDAMLTRAGGARISAQALPDA